MVDCFSLYLQVIEKCGLYVPSEHTLRLFISSLKCLELCPWQDPLSLLLQGIGSL